MPPMNRNQHSRHGHGSYRPSGGGAGSTSGPGEDKSRQGVSGAGFSNKAVDRDGRDRDGRDRRDKPGPSHAYIGNQASTLHTSGVGGTSPGPSPGTNTNTNTSTNTNTNANATSTSIPSHSIASEDGKAESSGVTAGGQPTFQTNNSATMLNHHNNTNLYHHNKQHHLQHSHLHHPQAQHMAPSTLPSPSTHLITGTSIHSSPTGLPSGPSLDSSASIHGPISAVGVGMSSLNKPLTHSSSMVPSSATLLNPTTSSTSMPSIQPLPGTPGAQSEFSQEILDLVAGLSNPDHRRHSIQALSQRPRELSVAPLLWYSFGVMAILVHEVVSMYPLLATSKITHALDLQCSRVIFLMQAVAGHEQTRKPFFEANITSFLYPFLRLAEWPNMRVATLGVFHELLRGGDPAMAVYFLGADLVRDCIDILTQCKDVSLLVAAAVIEQIISCGVCLDMIGTNLDRLQRICLALDAAAQTVLTQSQDPSSPARFRLGTLKSIVATFARLADINEPTARELVRQRIPAALNSPVLTEMIHNDVAFNDTVQRLVGLHQSSASSASSSASGSMSSSVSTSSSSSSSSSTATGSASTLPISSSTPSTSTSSSSSSSSSSTTTASNTMAHGQTSNVNTVTNGNGYNATI